MITADDLKQRKKEHAKLTIKLHGQGMTYEQAVKQGDTAREMLKGMNPLSDPLYRFCLKKQNHGYEVAAALSWLAESDSTGHLQEIHALVKRKGSPGVEVDALVSKSNSEGMLSSAILCYFFEKQIFANQDPGPASDYEVVLL